LRPGDIVVGAFPGALTTKTRPAVVLSTEDYQRHRPDVVVGLITTQAPRPLTPTDCVLALGCTLHLILGCFPSLSRSGKFA
jgi:mRNA-degrading endonuclease toxin of MazEF toxin-antitoxin module